MINFKYVKNGRAKIEFSEEDAAAFRLIRENFRTENKAARFARQYAYSQSEWKYMIKPLGGYMAGVTCTLLKFCLDHGIKFTIDPELVKIVKPKTFIEEIQPVPNPKYKYRDYQKTLVEALAKNGRGIILAPTRSGKSLVLAGLFHNLLLKQNKNGIRNILLIVPNLLLVEQFMNDLTDYYTVGDLTVEIKTDDGRTVMLDGDTEVETSEGHVRAGELKKGDLYEEPAR